MHLRPGNAAAPAAIVSSRLLFAPLAALLVLTSACSVTRPGIQPAPRSAFVPLAEDAPLDRVFAAQRSENPQASGVRLIAQGSDAFVLRALTARAAQRSLDLQYYIWRSDATGRCLAYEALLAADRGVRVRLLLDDMDARSRDGLLMALDQHPNIEIRLFNPFATRSGALRTLAEMFSRGSRLNHRMHNKAWLADGRVAIVGGRNVGDEYFAASKTMNFVDLDVLLAGPAVEDAERSFDEYWNSRSAVPIAHLNRTSRNKRTLADVRTMLAQSMAANAQADYLRQLDDSPTVDELFADRYALTWSTEVHVVADDPRKAIKRAQDINPGVLQSIASSLEHAQHELLLISPYFVPGVGGTDQLRRKALTGTTVSVLTNSLAATDVAAVHGGYSRYRKALLQGGVHLYELKPVPYDDGRGEDGTHERMRLGSSKASLHTKAAIVDRERIFVGSFNLDPRSATLNCEMGAWIHDASLAEELAALFQLGASRRRSFSVTLDADQNLLWTDEWQGRTRYSHHDPVASWRRRSITWVLRHLPIESQL
ncbi:MAG TPA: phospholipase D family protein [Povalibacter sp.]|nr:phospholipase D family protein [Povalibacter sp.]